MHFSLMFSAKAIGLEPWLRDPEAIAAMSPYTSGGPVLRCLPFVTGQVKCSCLQEQ